jgi:hypothetical protein
LGEEAFVFITLSSAIVLSAKAHLGTLPKIYTKLTIEELGDQYKVVFVGILLESAGKNGRDTLAS